MSTLVDDAVRAAGLADVLATRGAGPLPADCLGRLRTADLLVLGAMANRVRVAEVGDEVKIYIGDARQDGDVVFLPSADSPPTGLELLRDVAIARLAGPPGARVRVDWSVCGLEIAQVALGFGASELAGRIASKRGLPIAEDAVAGVGKKSRHELAQVIKRRELADCIRVIGRVPVFVQEDGVIRHANDAEGETT